ncbi:hypothetical protein K1719_042397 [Acacia pycnantha]|nr:hypothetical protein K1719_042397 [Acacia pycnantha]
MRCDLESARMRVGSGHHNLGPLEPIIMVLSDRVWFRKPIDALNNSEQIVQTSEEVFGLIIKAFKEHPKAEAKGVKLELHTLPVDGKAMANGDTLTLYVRASDPEEVNLVPSHVLEENLKRKQGQTLRNYVEVNALHQQIIDYGYRVIKFQNEEVRVHKYRIRLRGIDAPESELPYDKDAREELTKRLLRD